MHKGFVFTMDAIVASFIVIFALGIIIVLTTTTSNLPFDKLQLDSIGNDFLAVLERNGTFISYIGKSQDFVSNDMQSNQYPLLPVQYCANTTIKVYKWQTGSFGSGPETTYNVVRTDCAPTYERTRVKRMDAAFGSAQFLLIEMELWLK
jgi:hypothetical protein